MCARRVLVAGGATHPIRLVLLACCLMSSVASGVYCHLSSFVVQKLLSVVFETSDDEETPPLTSGLSVRVGLETTLIDAA